MGHLSASEFVELHQALLVKHARASTKPATDDRGPPLPAEDVTAGVDWAALLPGDPAAGDRISRNVRRP